jgi:hypothetical protein
VIQFVPEELAKHPLVRWLNGKSTWSLRALPSWFEAEYRRYEGISPSFMQLSLRGPFTESITPPPLPAAEDPWWQILSKSYAFPRYFHSLARKYNINPDTFGARIYVIYGQGESTLASDSRGSKKGRIAVVYINVDDPNLAYAQITVAHELAHILGAHDLYEEGTFQSIFPEGYVEPHLLPRFPQHFAELMAVDIPLSFSKEREARSLDEVRIGYQTAADLGWIPQEQAALYYYSPEVAEP